MATQYPNYAFISCPPPPTHTLQGKKPQTDKSCAHLFHCCTVHLDITALHLPTDVVIY